MKLEKKLIIAGVVSLGMVACFGATLSTLGGNLSAFRSKADETVNDSITFDYNTRVRAFSTYYTSFKATTSRGTEIYMINRSYYSLTSGKVIANFSNKAEDFTGFYTADSLENEFVFQNITSISMTFSSKTDAGVDFDIQYTKNGSANTYSGQSLKGNTLVVNDVAGASKIKIDPTFSSNAWFQLTSLTINYSCDPSGEPEPVEPELSSIYVVSPKKRYAKDGEFVAPVVKGKYTIGDNQVIEGAEFSGFDSSNNVEDQVITVSYGGKSTTYKISVRPTETSVYVKYVFRDWTTGDYLTGDDSSMQKYAEPGGAVTMVAPAITGFEFFSYYPDESRDDIWEQIGDDFPTASTLTLTMSSYDLEMTVCYVPAE